MTALQTELVKMIHTVLLIVSVQSAKLTHRKVTSHRTHTHTHTVLHRLINSWKQRMGSIHRMTQIAQSTATTAQNSPECPQTRYSLWDVILQLCIHLRALQRAKPRTERLNVKVPRHFRTKKKNNKKKKHSKQFKGLSYYQQRSIRGTHCSS